MFHTLFLTLEVLHHVGNEMAGQINRTSPPWLSLVGRQVPDLHKLSYSYLLIKAWNKKKKCLGNNFTQLLIDVIWVILWGGLALLWGFEPKMRRLWYYVNSVFNLVVLLHQYKICAFSHTIESMVQKLWGHAGYITQNRSRERTKPLKQHSGLNICNN